MRILIAEDDPVSCRLLQARLVQWGYEVAVATDGDQAWRILQEPEAPTLAILDWMMPGLDGVEICRAVRERPNTRYTYLILLTARCRKQDLAEGLEAGADDYLIKPFDTLELRARLRAGERIIDLQADLVSALETLRYQATHDALTRCWNHSAILDLFRREMARAEREGCSLGVILGDLDRFKEVNDTHGHQVGDAVLRDVSRRLRTTLRVYDQIGRYGGEEFLILLPGCNPGATLEVAERLRSSIEQEPVETEAGSLPVTISLGVATRDHASLAPADALLRAADVALYRAKRSGRNRIELAAPMAPIAEKEVPGVAAELPCYALSAHPRGRRDDGLAPGDELSHGAGRDRTGTPFE